MRDTEVGLLRHFSGGPQESLWNYAPSEPPYPLLRARTFIWTFEDSVQTKTDTVDANAYKWKETNDGSGAALGPLDVVGGAAQFTNNGADDKYYFYESFAEIAQLVPTYDLWFKAVIQVSDATQSDMFIGLCARITGNLFDNRVNCVGFRKTDGNTNIDLETSLASSATRETAAGTLVDDTDIELGFHYVGGGSTPEVLFFIDKAFTKKITATLPTTEMCVSFGLRNGEAVAKVMKIKTIQLMIEVEK